MSLKVHLTNARIIFSVFDRRTRNFLDQSHVLTCLKYPCCASNRFTDVCFFLSIKIISNTINKTISTPKGTVTIVELKEVMKSLGQNPTEKELKAMIDSVDDNGDNEIDFEEFLLLMSTKKGSGKVDPDKELREAFKVFDKDGNGTISKVELKHLMSNLGQKLSDEELDAMMGEVDTDGNGEIDFDEFKQMMVSFILPCKNIFFR